eukprot:gb/GECH01012272.1/.p1 GENE.gb/GECH01012272.1/~~gb/GECH01012272.1/.p1  ORF type:complete len:121 (+),score=39.32 gb/GECH01012272.1/:1-363(+)
MGRDRELAARMESMEIEEIIDLTHAENSNLRRKVVRELCPCKVKANIEEIWQRLLEMVNDPNGDVRLAVVHTLCDGSPCELELEIAEALEDKYNDQDPRVRKLARRAFNSYRRTGKWNVL